MIRRSFSLVAIALLLFTTGWSENSIKLNCPVAASGDDDSIAIQVLITNDVELGAFSLGFHYNSDDVEITSCQTGPAIPFGTDVIIDNNSAPSDNKVHFSWITFTHPMPPQSDVVLFTMWMQVGADAVSQCVDLDSVWVAPAGQFIFSPSAGGKITPEYHDCGIVI